MKSLSDVGEEKLLEWLTSVAPGSTRDTVLGNGSDAAVLSLSGRLAFKLDTAVYRLPLSGMSGFDAGWKAGAACLSDVAAVGGKPLYVLGSVSAPRELDSSVFRKIVRGLVASTQRFGATLVGGDLSETKELCVTVAALGLVGGRPLPRHRSRPGDLIAVSRLFGLEPLGLRIALRKIKASNSLSKLALRRFLHPLPEAEYGVMLSETGQVHSCTDSSDGLLASITNILDQDTDAIVDSLPTHPSLRELPLQTSEQLTVAGGEEYSLVYSYPQSAHKHIHEILARIHRRPFVIGKIVEGTGKIWLRKDGRLVEAKVGGWKQFQSKPLRAKK
ncbi:MAG: thiamine-phosphate kinase [Thermoprotei archaeon]